MTNDDYHADTSAISASGLKLFRRSPAHHYAAYLDPNRIERKPTAAMKLGTATHCAILEPERFNGEYTVVMPEGLDRHTTAGKQAYADLLASGVEILSADEMARVMNMACAFRDNEITPHTVRPQAFCRAVHFAEVNGVSVSAGPDFMTSDFLMVIDVKPPAMPA